MRVRADSYFLVAAALLSATQVASAQLANPYPWCASDRGRTDAPSCYYNDGKLCWVTMSGIGVCVPFLASKRRIDGVRDVSAAHPIAPDLANGGSAL